MVRHSLDYGRLGNKCVISRQIISLGSLCLCKTFFSPNRNLEITSFSDRLNILVADTMLIQFKSSSVAICLCKTSLCCFQLSGSQQYIESMLYIQANLCIVTKNRFRICMRLPFSYLIVKKYKRQINKNNSSLQIMDCDTFYHL